MRKLKFFLFVLLMSMMALPVNSARIKDIATLAGVRENQLIGYGLIVGLDGTGDKTNQAPFTNQSFTNMLLDFGIRLPPNSRSSQLKNVAAVAISAKLPPFARIGQKLDVTISSLGNATSLRGGTLLMAPLRGADGKVYAMSQGSILVSGFGAQGADGSKVVVNVTSSGTIPNGATVENVIDTPFVKNGAIIFELIRPDFTTSERIEQAINRNYGAKVARALDAKAVAVKVGDIIYSIERAGGYKGDVESIVNEPAEKSRYVPIVSRIENIELDPGEVSAKVIVNSRTGTIVIGQNVTLSPVAVSHGNLSVIVTERPYVSQPNAFASGKTVSGKASDINVSQQANRAFVFDPAPSLNDLVESINAVGAAPSDLIAILEAIKAAGALNGDLEII
jgi:flagellar P-ring protein precursor FlgI